MSGVALPKPPTLGRRWWWLLAVAAAVVIAIPVAIFLTASSSCGCAIPPSEDDAIESARDYVAGVADGTVEVSDPERADVLADLDDPGTVWAVVHTRRPDGGYGDSPAVRVVAGLSPAGTWDAVVVNTETDYKDGDVDPDVRHLPDSRPETVRGGATPIFSSVSGSSSGDDSVHTMALLAIGQEPQPVAPLQSSQNWVYTGEGLTPGRYLVVEGGENMGEDPPVPFVTAIWFDVPEAPR